MQSNSERQGYESAGVKYEHLLESLQGLGSLLVAFSGGVDSTFLVAAAREALGSKVLAVTAVSPVHPRRESEKARQLAGSMGVTHITLPSGEMDVPAFLLNGPDRCYHCKKDLFRRLFQEAHSRGIPFVAHGANRDDQGDYRPGSVAAREAGALAPLSETGFSKPEIRFLSRKMGLGTWNKPAMACLATRIPYGSPVTREKLAMVEEAEDFLRERGFDAVRVRHHDTVARIEVPPSDVGTMVSDTHRKPVLERLQRVGFEHIALDLEGYVSGKMNRELPDTPHLSPINPTPCPSPLRERDVGSERNQGKIL